jgi:hypothetical protein
MVLPIIAFFRQLIDWRGMKRCREHKHKWIDTPHKTRSNVLITRCKYCGIGFWTIK